LWETRERSRRWGERARMALEFRAGDRHGKRHGTGAGGSRRDPKRLAAPGCGVRRAGPGRAWGGGGGGGGGESGGESPAGCRG